MIRDTHPAALQRSKILSILSILAKFMFHLLRDQQGEIRWRQTYKTSDIYVAALLRTAGLKFVGLTKNGVRGVFEFEDSPEREKLILDFFNGQVVQNIRQYVDNWMHFKKLVERL